MGKKQQIQQQTQDQFQQDQGQNYNGNTQVQDFQNYNGNAQIQASTLVEKNPEPISQPTDGGNGGILTNGKESTLTSPITDKNSFIIVVFGGAIILYIVISGLIYLSSYIVKNKEDDLTEDFYKEITKEKKENNQFFMDPALHKSPAIKAAENEEGSYQKLDNKDDYDHIWDNYIVTGKNDDIEIDINKRNEYPITTPVTPVTPVSPSPLQQSFTNESYNMAIGNSDVAQKRSIGHRESNSTSSSTASVSNLIPKSQKKANEAYNNEDIRRSPPAPAHHQFPNGRPNGPQVKFTMEQNPSRSNNNSPGPHHDKRGQLAPPNHQGSRSGSNNASPRSPRPSPNVERQGSQGSQRPNPRSPNLVERQGSHPNPRSPNPVERQGSHPNPRSPNLERQGSHPHPQNPRSPNLERQGSQGYPRSPPNRGPERQGSSGNVRTPPLRGPERQGSSGSVRSPPLRGPERQGSNGNLRPTQNQRPQPRSPQPRSPNSPKTRY